MKIYILTVSSGEYEDFREYNICAFTSRKLANAALKECVKQADQFAERKSALQQRMDRDFPDGARGNYDAWERAHEETEAKIEKVRRRLMKIDHMSAHDDGALTYSWQIVELHDIPLWVS